MGKSSLEIEAAVYDALDRMRRVDRKEIATFMIDPVVLYILGATSKRCLMVSEMVPVVNLPAATCYKIVYQMESLGLIACCGSGRTTGRGRAAVYTSVMKELVLDMKNSIMHISITWKNGVTEEFRRDLLPPTELAVREQGFKIIEPLMAEDEALSFD
ncbi:MAG: hypothetical protein NT131_07375 [Methanomassiliicoccales archaeon]|nr:hypothetical protein [Methanomassiliicoccales archaeon]